MKRSISSKLARLSRKPIIAHFLRQPVLCRALLATAVVLVLLTVFSISLWSCPVLRICHIPCPGCGLTRSVKFLLLGDVTSSMRYHPLGAVAVVSGVVLLGGAFLPRRIRIGIGRIVSPWERRVRLHGLILGTLIFSWIFRLLGLALGFFSLHHLTQ